jgi:hypothetical protein
MNALQSPIGQERTVPEKCAVGDWISAASLPHWPVEWCRDRSAPGRFQNDPMIFKPLPYMDGEERTVWIRIG